MKLTTKIVLLLVAVVMLVTIAAGALSLRSAYATLEQRQQEQASELAGELEERLRSAWDAAGPVGVDRAVHQWVELTRRPLVAEFVLFTADPDNQFTPRVPRSLWPVVRRGQIFSRIGTDESGGRNLHTYLPLEFSNGQMGALEVTQSLYALDEQTKHLMLATIVGLLAFGLLGVAVTYTAGVRWVARPLQALIEHTQRIGHGDFSARTELGSGDELDELARALNAMSQQLADQQATIQRQTEDRLRALEQLRHAERLGTLGRMAAGLAHELGTPLNVVGGRAALIASGRLPPEEIMYSAQTIKSETDRITKIVRQMLDFARQRRPHPTRCDLSELVQRTLHLLQPIAEKKQVKLEFLPNQPDGRSLCNADESLLQQVLTNLIINAIQATPSGGQVRLSIQPGTRDDDPQLDSPQLDSPQLDCQWWCVVVDDSGPGVPPEIRDQIFEPFFTTKEVGEGTGLGLSIAYGILQEHAGRLSVSDSPLGGARFEMCLPASQPAAN